MLTKEDLQAIEALIDSKLQAMDASIDSKLKPITDKLDVLEIKHDITSKKLEDINFRLTSLEYSTKREFTKINDEMNTLIAVLEAKDILPKQA